MESVFGFTEALLSIVERLVDGFAALLPRALTALIVILIGVLIAKIIEKALATGFEKLKIDALLEKAGVTETLEKLGLREPPGKLLSRAVYFLLVMLFIQSATQAVGLLVISDAIGSFFAYLPNLVAACLIMLFGFMLARFAGKTVTRSAEESGMDQAGILGRIVSSMIVFVVAIIAITQLKIDVEMVKSVVLVLLAGGTLAVALSFGLGTREVSRNIVAGFYARKLFQIGEVVEVGGERGVLTAITPMQTLVEREGQVIAIPNRVFLVEVTKQD